ncbi:hypothetical protein R1sor_016527 [Riccia sorocarpa]|uniref:Early nodulin-93 n=1 Tax=Riccia sorocarpa TaxID=122646 RepID=A0ABD3HFP4_9MARC
MASAAREWWSQRREKMEGRECRTCSSRFMIPSVKEVAAATVDSVLHRDGKHSTNAEEERRLARAHECTNAGVKAGLEAGTYAGVISSIGTFAGVRFIPWAKANLNYTAQALIISAATVGTYFVVTEKTILACSRDASYARLERERASAQST